MMGMTLAHLVVHPSNPSRCATCLTPVWPWSPMRLTYTPLDVPEVVSKHISYVV